MNTSGRVSRYLSFSLLSFLSLPALSSADHVYFGVSMAASSARMANHSPQISYLSGDIITDSYPLTRKRSSKPVFNVNTGYEFAGEHWKPAVAIGLGLYSNLADYTYNGQVVETAAPDASTLLYHYNYKVASTRLMAEIQFTWIMARVSPFINIGVGGSGNRARQYNETAINDTSYPPLPPFHANTQSHVAYQAGFGLSTAFHVGHANTDYQPERITLGYRYVDAGKSSFGIRNDIYPFALNTGSLKVNEIYIGYTHLF